MYRVHGAVRQQRSLTEVSLYHSSRSTRPVTGQWTTITVHFMNDV